MYKRQGVECIGVIDYCEKYQKLSGVLLIYCLLYTSINGRSGIPVSLDKEEYMELNTEPEEPDSAENENTLETPEMCIRDRAMTVHSVPLRW